MKKEKLKHILEILSMGLALLIAIFVVTKFSAHQYSSHEVRVKNFFALENNTIDVVNIGASEIYTGFSPEHLWKNYGITSYNLATAGAPMGLAENQIKAIKERQNPKLIVISLNGLQYNDKRANAEGYLRMWIDNMPNSSIRDEAIEKLVIGDKLSYKYKILKYHSNILRFVESFELTKMEILAKHNKERLIANGIDGMASQNREFIEKDDVRNMREFNETSPLLPKTKKQLDDLIEFLKKEDIKNVIFVNMPVYYSKTSNRGLKTRRRINEGMNLLKKEGFEVLDLSLEMDEIGLDSKKDFYNWGHLNVIGQRKMTDYFAKKVLEGKGVGRTKLSSEEIKRWEENYKAYSKLFDWAKSHIEKDPPYSMHYNYKTINHLLNGGIEGHEKYLRMKAELIRKKELKKEEKKKNKGK